MSARRKQVSDCSSGSASTSTLPGGTISNSAGYENRGDSYEDIEYIAGDSDCDSEKNSLMKYGGYPIIPKISTRMDIAAAERLDEDMFQAIEKLDAVENNDLQTGHPWIKIEDRSEYIDEGAERFGRLGVVGRATYDLAALNAQNKEYERCIVEYMTKQGHNEQLMKDLNEKRRLAAENEEMYKKMRSGYRQSAGEVSDSKKAALGAKPMPAYLSTSADRVMEVVKKRKGVVEEKHHVVLFGSKPLAKKIRTSTGVPPADGSSTEGGEVAGGGGSEVSDKGDVGAASVSMQDESVVMLE